MSQHKIIFHVELTDGDGAEVALQAIRTSMIMAATSGFGITDYENGKAFGHGGYEGPFLTGIQATDPDS
jgi:hypothetical protein